MGLLIRALAAIRRRRLFALLQHLVQMESFRSGMLFFYSCLQNKLSVSSCPIIFWIYFQGVVDCGLRIALDCDLLIRGFRFSLAFIPFNRELRFLRALVRLPRIDMAARRTVFSSRLFIFHPSLVQARHPTL